MPPVTTRIGVPVVGVPTKTDWDASIIGSLFELVFSKESVLEKTANRDPIRIKAPEREGGLGKGGKSFSSESFPPFPNLF